MAGRSRKKASGGGTPWYRAPWLGGVLLIACGLYGGLAITGDPGAWSGLLYGRQPDRLFPDGNPGGPVGSLFNVATRLGFGSLWCWAVPLGLLAFGIGSLTGRNDRVRAWLWRALPLWLVTTMWLGQRDWPLGQPGAATWDDGWRRSFLLGEFGSYSRWRCYFLCSHSTWRPMRGTARR